jgi:hypothetical protein
MTKLYFMILYTLLVSRFFQRQIDRNTNIRENPLLWLRAMSQSAKSTGDNYLRRCKSLFHQSPLQRRNTALIGGKTDVTSAVTTESLGASDSIADRMASSLPDIFAPTNPGCNNENDEMTQSVRLKRRSLFEDEDEENGRQQRRKFVAYVLQTPEQNNYSPIAAVRDAMRTKLNALATYPAANVELSTVQMNVPMPHATDRSK